MEAKMSDSENKALMRAFYEEVWNGGNLPAISQYVADDLVDHNPVFPGQAAGRTGFEQLVAMVRNGFPDLHRTINLQVAEGDLVVDYFTDRETNTGAFMGLPATGKSATMNGINIERIAGGKIVELWHVEEIFNLLMQTGLISAPQAG
jgi:steroid delta-isomerase-like uncharacterized protein